MERSTPDEVDPDFEALLVFLKEARGFDFTGYKRASLVRRVGRRMREVGIESYADYLDHLQVTPGEFVALFNTILINVTGFFRDPSMWAVLRDRVVPELLAARPPDAPLRVWSAGCASGEEAYSIAIVLAEALGTEEYRRRVKVYATDVDDDALAAARAATYPDSDVADLDPELCARYFERRDGRYAFRKDLRRTVIFGRNDLVQDAPISRVDLLLCRNTLMYLTPETQDRILGRFHFALAPDGVLVLGASEMLLRHAALLEPVDLPHRVFRRRATIPLGSRAPFTASWSPSLGVSDRLRDQAFAAAPVAQLVVTPDDVVALVNTEAEVLLGLTAADVGRPLQDLQVSYRPVELRSVVEQVRADSRPQVISDVPWPDGERWFEVRVAPLTGADGSQIGVSVAFRDTTSAHRLVSDLQGANEQLESAYEEVQSTSEELETTNEELQSAIEELETTNEELQSTNEELETMNEELQSSNDELQTINESASQRGAALDEANAFLEAVLGSLRAGVVVVGTDLRVVAWNRTAEELWGLRRDEAVGEHLLGLDIGLPLERVRPLVTGALADAAAPTEAELDAVNRRGRAVTVRLTCSALRAADGRVRGATLVMDPQPAASAASSASSDGR